jgi:hypothetical protein
VHFAGPKELNCKFVQCASPDSLLRSLCGPSALSVVKLYFRYETQMPYLQEAH